MAEYKAAQRYFDVKLTVAEVEMIARITKQSKSLPFQDEVVSSINQKMKSILENGK